MRSAAVALAMAFSFFAIGEIALAGSDSTPPTSVDFSRDLEQFPQLHTDDVFAIPQDEPFVDWRVPTATTETSPSNDALPVGPVAPLPPPLVIGPAGMALAGWVAWRVKKRGRI